MRCCLAVRSSISITSQSSTRRPSISPTITHKYAASGAARRGTGLGGVGGRRLPLAPPSSVEGLLLHLALRFPVVRHTAPRRLPLPVRPATAERTAQVPPPGVARVGQKKDPAVPASRQALSQPGLIPQHRSQHHVIRQHQGATGSSRYHPGANRKWRCDLRCKKPRLSL